MKRVFLCLALASAGCFQESRQSRVSVHHDLTLGLPEAAQREFFEALENKTESVGAPPLPFLAGSDGAHLWLVATSEAQHNVLTLGPENQGGARTLKTLTAHA